jgi:hypothetical protein
VRTDHRRGPRGPGGRCEARQRLRSGRPSGVLLAQDVEQGSRHAAGRRRGAGGWGDVITVGRGRQRSAAPPPTTTATRSRSTSGPGQERTLIFALGEGGGGAAFSSTASHRALASGLQFGLIIAITAIGLSLIFGTTGLVNFAHGELVTLGASSPGSFNAPAGPGSGSS